MENSQKNSAEKKPERKPTDVGEIVVMQHGDDFRGGRLISVVAEFVHAEDQMFERSAVQIGIREKRVDMVAKLRRFADMVERGAM